MSDICKLPELGEGVETGTITKVMVKVGDTVVIDQPVLEIETDKAVLEVPSNVSGTVTEILAKEGEQVGEGHAIFKVSDSEAAAKPAEEAPAKEETPEVVPVEAPPVEVAAEEPEPEPEAPSEPAPTTEMAPRPTEPVTPGKDPVAAAPHVRGFAREIGLDINEVPGTGPGGRITMGDVKRHSKQINMATRGMGGVGAVAAARPLPDFSRWGEVEREPMNSVRRRTAENLSGAWASVPHVTQNEKVDITNVEAMRKRYAKRVAEAGGKLTMTAILAKVLAAALKRFPQFNSSVDITNNEIVYKQFYNIGIAADTDRGLIVPVIKNVDQKSLTEICVELTELAERARTKKTTLDELQGATFTISNLGGIGGTSFTPIVNAPEVAILGVSRGRMEPVYQDDGTFEARLMLPLSLSYDHRVIDGADGARFIVYLREVLEEPFLLFLDS